MSHGKFKSSFLFLVLILRCMGSCPWAFAESPQDGTLAPDEAKVLWERATTDFEKTQYESAAHALRRLTARVPTHPQWLQAQKLLGEAELRLRNYKAAQEAFQTFLSNTKGRGEISDSVRTLLAETHLQASQPTEALLISEKMLSKSTLGQWKRPLESQIHKVRALLALGQIKRAQSTLEMALKRPLTQTQDPEWASDWLASLQIQLKSAQCDGFVPRIAQPTLDEAQVMDQVRRHGLCIEELQGLRSKKQPSSASIASVQALGAFEKTKLKFSQACQGPKDVSRAGGIKRTAEEQEFYRRELRRKLSEICDPLLGQSHQAQGNS